MQGGRDTARESPDHGNRAQGSATKSKRKARLEPGQRSRARSAAALAALTVLASVVVAYFAYEGSRRALTRQLALSSETLVQSVRVHSERLAATGVERTQALEQAWAATRGEQQGLYLCFVGADGKLDLHTLNAASVGTRVSGVSAAGPGEFPANVDDLLREKRSWTGENVNLDGKQQVVAFSYSKPLGGLVAVHVPRSVIDQHARAGMLPWAYGMGAVVLLLLPAALWLLHSTHRRAEQALAKAHAQREELADQLMRSRQLESLGRLAGGIAHDFNNLLMVVLAGVDGLEEEKLTSEGRQDLHDIQSAAERGSILVKQMLTFGAGRRAQQEVLDTGELLRGVINMLERLVGERIELELDLARVPLRVRANRGQLEQVLTNLVINARDALPDGGRITIHASEKPCPEDYLGKPSATGRCLCLSVEDEGTGMTPEVLEHAMEPFFTTKQRKGTGLGLATAYGIAKQHDGHLSVESQPGQGTTVSLYLPLVDEAVTREAAHDEGVRVSAKGQRVLVVEDEEGVRKSLVRGLEKAGYEVETASDAVEARRRLDGAREPFRLLVTDVVMPGENGERLARSLLATDQQLRILLISGHALTPSAEHTTDPRLAFLAKPFTNAALKAKLDELDGREATPHASSA